MKVQDAEVRVREREWARGARAATKEHRSAGSGLGQGKRSLIARGVAGEGEKLFSVCRHSRVYSDYQKVRVVPGLQLPKVSVSVPLSEVMAKSITSACARAVVCPSKRSLFFSCVLVRRNSSFVSVEVPRRKARVDVGVAATTVRNQSTCQSSFILESALGPVDVPNTTLPNYIWRDFEEWSDKPAVVSKQPDQLWLVWWSRLPWLQQCDLNQLIDNIRLLYLPEEGSLCQFPYYDFPLAKLGISSFIICQIWVIVLIMLCTYLKI